MALVSVLLFFLPSLFLFVFFSLSFDRREEQWIERDNGREMVVVREAEIDQKTENVQIIQPHHGTSIKEQKVQVKVIINGIDNRTKNNISHIRERHKDTEATSNI